MRWPQKRAAHQEQTPSADQLALAREIGVRAAALAQEDIALGIDAIVDTVVDGLETEQRRKLVLDVFAELPATERLDALQRVLGDEAFAAALQLERERAVQYGAFMRTAAELSETATLSRQVRLRELPYGVETQIELCDPDSLKQADTYDELPQADRGCYRRLAVLPRPDGRQQVTEDFYWDGHGPQTIFSPNELAEFGTATREPDGTFAEFEPVITFGTPLHFREKRVKDPIRPIQCGETVLAVYQVALGGQRLYGW